MTIKSASNLTELKKSLRIDGANSPCNGGLRSICWKVRSKFHLGVLLSNVLIDIFVVSKHRDHGLGTRP